MATPITITGDVGRISTAANDTASIKWYIYERPFGTGTTLYVQRETADGFEDEVRLLEEGEKPEIYFDVRDRQWIILYVLNESLYMITADENDVPITLAGQTGTTIDDFRLGFLTQKRGKDQVVQQIAAELSTGRASIDVDDTKGVDQVSIGSGDGGNWILRWRATQSTSTNQNPNVAGFNVYIRRFSDGALVRLNNELIPFEGFDPKIYEFQFSPIEGRFYVSQVNYRDSARKNTVEGRIKPPVDETAAVFANESKFGKIFGDPFGVVNFVFIDTSPVVSLINDLAPLYVFDDSITSNALIPSISAYDIVQVVSGSTQPIQEISNQAVFNEGLFLFISGAGLDSIVIG